MIKVIDIDTKKKNQKDLYKEESSRNINCSSHNGELSFGILPAAHVPAAHVPATHIPTAHVLLQPTVPEPMQLRRSIVHI